MLTVKQAAVRAGVSPGIVYAWINGNVLAHYRVGRPGTRGSIRIAEADLAAFMATLKREGRQALSAPVAPRPQPLRLQHLRPPGA